MSNQIPQETSGEILMQSQPNPSPSEQNQYALQPKQYPIQPSKVYPQSAPYSDQAEPHSDQPAPYTENQILNDQYIQPQIEYPDFENKNDPIYATCKACHKSGNTSVKSGVSAMQF